MVWFLGQKNLEARLSDADKKVQDFCSQLAAAIRSGSVRIRSPFAKPSVFLMNFKGMDIVCERHYHRDRIDLRMTIKQTPVYEVNVTVLAQELLSALAWFDEQEQDQQGLHDQSVERKKREEMARVLS